MIPLLAASSALSAVGSVASAVQKLTSSKGAPDSAAAAETDGPRSFGAMLASQGVVPPEAGSAWSATGRPAPVAGKGHHGGSHHVDTLA